ncbi:MAG TPA: MurR/RpiR family transcriptional regulator [Symbiobacteriaceae bacterium]
MERSSEPGGCLHRLRSILDTLKHAERRAAEYILRQPHEIIHLSISELAERCGASETTIFRLCRRLGFSGYQGMKISLARDLVEPLALIHEEVIEGDSPWAVTQKVFQSTMRSLADTLKVLSPQELERAASVFVKARKVEFYGVGGSGIVALDAMHKFMRTGLLCAAYTDPHLQVMSASLLGPEDVAVGISHSGSSKDTVEALEVAKKAGATTVAITDKARSPIVKVADIVLCTASAETGFRTEAMASRVCQLAIIDSLFVAVGLARKEATLASVQRVREAIALKRY